MIDWRKKIKLRYPALILLLVTLLFWNLYDRYERVGAPLLENLTLQEAAVQRGECSEQDGRFILTVTEEQKNPRIVFKLPPVSHPAQIRVKGRIKTKDVVVGKHPWNCARAILIQRDKNRKWTPGPHVSATESETHRWKKFEAVFDTRAATEFVELQLEQTGKSGSAEFDRLMVEIVKQRPSFNIWRLSFALLWGTTGLLYFGRCRLNKRRLRVLITLNAIAIIFGILMPEKWVSESGEFTEKKVETIVKAAQPPPKPTPTTAQKPTTTIKPVPQKPAPLKDDEITQKVEQVSEKIGGIHGAGHFLLFSSLCFLVYLSAALERQHRIYYLKVVLDILLFAAITESLQYLTLTRTPGIKDWITDALGMTLALLLFIPSKLIFFRRRPQRKRPQACK